MNGSGGGVRRPGAFPWHGRPAPEHCAVGEGVIDWAPIVEELLLGGYDGYWAIEYEEPDDVIRGTRDSAEYLRRVIAEAG